MKLDDAENYDGSLKVAHSTMSFDETDIEKGITLGVIGCETDYQGVIYLDNVTILKEGKAAEGETVSFTVSLVDLSDVYDDYIPVDITRIVVNSSDTGEEEIEIGSGEGTFLFKMPAHDVTVMFYLMSQ